MHASRLQDAADIGHSKKGDTKKAGCISGLYIRYDQGAHPCDLGRADHRCLYSTYPVSYTHLGGTSVPMRSSVTSEAILASSISTCFSSRVSGFRVVSQSWEASISPRPL